MNNLFLTTIALCFACVSCAPPSFSDNASNNRNARRVFTPIASIKVQTSNTAGSSINKWKGVGVPAAFPVISPTSPFISCKCPNSKGWQFEELRQHESRTKLTGGPYDCFCSGPNGFFVEFRGLLPKEYEDCECPSSYGWSLDDLLEHQARTNLSGDFTDCFCSDRHGFYLKDFPRKSQSFEDEISSDTSKNMAKCSCPRQNVWTSRQLEILQSNTNFSGNPTDCVCSSASDLPDDIHHRLESCTCEDCSKPANQRNLLKVGDIGCSCAGCISDKPQSQDQNPKTQPQTHLVAMTVDGNIKEIHLGPILIKLL